MSHDNKIVWSEGLFLRPQHFQQQARYMERFVEERCEALRPFAWGFKELQIDEQLLSVGKLAISRASGVFPDGTPFQFPDEYQSPAPLDVQDSMRDVVVYLSLPARRRGGAEVAQRPSTEGLARYEARELEISDTCTENPGSAVVQVGNLRTSYLLDTEPRGDYVCLGAAHIVEIRPDKQVLLDPAYIAPVMDCQAASQLRGWLNELSGLVHQRAEELATRVNEPGRGGTSELEQFLLLQSTNRYEPLVAHLATLHGLHPELLYRTLLEMAGELITYSQRHRRRPTPFPTYDHDDLRATFKPVVAILRDALSEIISYRAVELEIQERRNNYWKANVEDRSLYDSALFVLAAKAEMPTEDLRRLFPAQIKVGAVEQIQTLVERALPGIGLTPLPQVPPQIPFHTGFVYFELERGGENWKAISRSGGVALHVGGRFPQLKMELWAIRSQS